MLSTAFGKIGASSLINEYTSLLSEAELRHRTRVAEKSARIERELANRVKSEFVANMSHELRTPLNTVLGFSKLLTEHKERRLPDDAVAEYAHLIHDAASHLLSVINDILDISKIQSGKYSLDAREVNLEEVIRAAQSTSKMLAEEAGVNMTARIALNLPPVKGDAAKLRQIFCNLLSNAIKFNKHGNEVSIVAGPSADRGVTVFIRDTGAGMTEDELRIAQTPFGQVDAGRARMHEGAGLGLPIAKALTELHGGEFRIRSGKQGTEVAIILPPANHVSITRGREAIFARRAAD